MADITLFAVEIGQSHADANIMGVLGITSKQLRTWATNQRFRYVNFKAANYYHHFINNSELTKPLVRDAYTLVV
jgi:ABC-type uncharacterized transport system YnjBCD ATPase subunit